MTCFTPGFKRDCLGHVAVAVTVACCGMLVRVAFRSAVAAPLLPAGARVIHVQAPGVVWAADASGQGGSAGQRTTIRVTTGGVERTAVLEPGRHPKAGGPPAEYRLVEVRPAPAVLDPASVAWVFAYMEPEADLLLPDGRRLAHPDRAALAELRAALRRAPADVQGVLTQLPRLLRIDARGALFVEMARGGTLDAAGREALVRALEAGDAGPLRTAAPDGIAPGGPTAEPLHQAFLALCARPDLAGPQADRLAAACVTLDWGHAQADVLASLTRPGLASTAALTAAAKQIPGSDDKRSVFVSLARARGSQAADANLIAESCTAIEWSHGQAQVLGGLIEAGGASTDALVAAVRQVPGADERRAVLLSLATRRGTNPAEADKIAAGSPAIGWSHGEAQVLTRLVETGGASAGALVAAVGQISGADDRRAVLLALAERRGDRAAEADVVAAACPAIDWSHGEAQVLSKLIERGAATTGTLVAAAAKISGADDRRAVLLALAQQRGGRGPEANAIAAACPTIGWTHGEAQVLRELVAQGGAAVPALLTAAGRISGAAERRDVLLALAQRKTLTPADADLVARAAPEIGWTTGTVEVLRALIGRATEHAIEDAAGGLSDWDRGQIRKAMGR